MTLSVNKINYKNVRGRCQERRRLRGFYLKTKVLAQSRRISKVTRILNFFALIACPLYANGSQGQTVVNDLNPG